MARISRRTMLYMATASTLAVSRSKMAAANATLPEPQIQTLYHYLEQTVPQLLRPPTGHFAHPSVSPSLPGREYSASLWDWDTLWSCRGLLAYSKARSDVTF